MKTRVPVLLALLVGIFSVPSFADTMSIEVIELRHGFAESLLPQVRPLLPEGASVSAYDNKLILKTTPGNLVEIRRVVQTLDRAPERLLVTVSFEDRRNARETGGSVRLEAPPGSIDVQTRSYRTRNRSTGDQQIQVLSGQPAYLNVGQDVPVLEIAPDVSGYPQAGIAYRSVGRGFSVTPRVNGDHVTLEITPSRSRLTSRGDGSIDTQNLDTVISGKLGEWIVLGGSTEFSSGTGRRYATRTTDVSDQTLYVKVERLP